MRSKLLLTSLFIIGSSLVSWAQEYGTLVNTAPITPNAASLFKSLEKPIGPFTGIVGVGIPIHTFSANGVTLPVNLSYSGGGGIKVEEVASTVGLGWSLSVGGAITRIRKSNPDDYPYQYLHSSYKPSTFSPTFTNLQNWSYGSIDLEPDLFLYSCNGMSGKFSFDESGNIVMLTKSADVKITPLYTNYSGNDYLAGFVLKDEQGNSYYFGANKSYTSGAADYSTTDFFSLGWPLVQILDINGREIASLEYEELQVYYKTRGQGFETRAFGGNTLGCSFSDYSGMEPEVLNGAFENVVKQIKMGGEKMVLSYSDRLDLDGSSKLSSIEIKDEANNLRKKYKLNYSYFIAPGASTGTNDPDFLYKRLKLLNISEQPSAGTDSLTHTFTYYENEMLPQRMSGACDYWGFYNGAGYNSTIVPSGLYKYGTTVAFNGGDRRTYHDYTGANTLKKVTFPSGGSREFTYEGNQVLYNDYYQNENLSCDYADHDHPSFDGDDIDNFDPGNTAAYTHDFTVNSDYGSAMFWFNLDGWAYNFLVKIIDKNDYYEYPLWEISNNNYGSYAIPNGNYRLELYYDNYGYFDHVYAWWDELNMTNNTISYFGNTYRKQHRDVGGQRLKTIDDYDPVTARHNYTRYKYYMPADTTLSSGLLISVPRILYTGNCPGKNCELMRISSQSNYPLNADNGSYVCYPYVRVIEDGNGYVDRAYSFEPDYGWGFEFPPVPATSNEAYRGQLLSARYYAENGALLKTDSIEYHYPAPAYPSATGLRIAIHKLDPYDLIYCTNTSDAIVNWTPLAKTSWTKTYDGARVIQNKTEYIYNDNIGRTGLKKQKTLQSNGTTRETWYRYPYNSNADFKLGLTAAERALKDTLLAHNDLSPLEVVTWSKNGSDSIFISGEKSMVDYFHTTHLHAAATRHFTSLSDSVQVNFSAYDTCGNLQEQYYANNVKEVYLWGYQCRYLVAKITGSSYATVAALVNNTVLQNPSSEAALRTELNNIRTGLAGSKALVTTYTYLPAVGLSSVTGPNGKTIFYEYDFHGRLLRIRDDNNNILQKYNYKVTQ